jgi:hypothetical protein
VPNVTGMRAEFVQAAGYELAGSEKTTGVIRGFQKTAFRRLSEDVICHHCGDFCGTSKCRVLSPKDLRCHVPREPLMLSALFVDVLEPAPADS